MCLSLFPSVWGVPSNPESTLQGFILPNAKTVMCHRTIYVRRNGNIQFSGLLDAKNVDAKLSCGRSATNAFPRSTPPAPALQRWRYRRSLWVENMVGSEIGSLPILPPVFRVDYMVWHRCEAETLPAHHARTGYHAFGTQPFPAARWFQRVLEITADGHKTNIKISDTERTQKLRIARRRSVRW